MTAPDTANGTHTFEVSVETCWCADSPGDSLAVFYVDPDGVLTNAPKVVAVPTCGGTVKFNVSATPKNKKSQVIVTVKGGKCTSAADCKGYTAIESAKFTIEP